jgi:hypothetical protein
MADMFRHPPERMTAPCAAFYEDQGRTLRFLVLVRRLAAQADASGLASAEALLRLSDDAADRAQAQRILDRGDFTQRELDEFTQLLLQMVLARSVDNYLTYVSELLRLVLRTRPETLDGETKVEVAFVLGHETMEELHVALADQRVDELAQSGFGELAGTLRDELGFSLFDDSGRLDLATRLVAARNVIVANRGVVDRSYLESAPGSDLRIGDPLLLEDSVVRDLDVLIGGVSDADARAAERWTLPTPVERGTLAEWPGGPR